MTACNYSKEIIFFLSVKDPHVLNLNHVFCKVVVLVLCLCGLNNFSLQTKKLHLLQHQVITKLKPLQ